MERGFQREDGEWLFKNQIKIALFKITEYNNVNGRQWIVELGYQVNIKGKYVQKLCTCCFD